MSLGVLVPPLTGANGVPGPQGAPGASAYEVAGGDAVWGNVATWLASLKGPQGAPGSGGGGVGGVLTQSQLRVLFGDFPPGSSSPGYNGVAALATAGWTGLNSHKNIYLPYGAGTYVGRYRLYLTTTTSDNIFGNAPNAPRSDTYLQTSTFDNAPPNPVNVTVKLQTAARLITVTFDGLTVRRLDPAADAIDCDPIVLTVDDLFIDATTGCPYIKEQTYEYVDGSLPAASDGNRYLVWFTVTAEGVSGSNGEPDKTAATLTTAGKGFWAEDWRICTWPGSISTDAKGRTVAPVALIGDSRGADTATMPQRMFSRRIPYTTAARAIASEVVWASLPASQPGYPPQGFGRKARVRGVKVAHHYYGINDDTLDPTLAAMQSLYRNDWLDLVARGVVRIVRETMYPSTGANPLTGASAPSCYQSLADQVPDRSRYPSEHIRIATNLWVKDPVWGPLAWMPVDFVALDTAALVEVKDVAPLLTSGGAAAQQVTVSAVTLSGANTLVTLSDVSALPDPLRLSGAGVQMPKTYPYMSGTAAGWAVVLGGVERVYTALNATSKVLTIPGDLTGVVHVGDAVSVPCWKYQPQTPPWTDDGLHLNGTGAAAVRDAHVAAGALDHYYL